MSHAPESASAGLTPRQARWALVGILLLAFGLRAAGIVWGQAYNPDGGQGDGLEAIEVAVSWLQGEGQAQFIGQPHFRAGSKLPGPAWTLVCAAGWALTGSGEGLAWLILALNMLALWLIHLLAVRTVGATAALLASAALAVSPLAVQNAIVVYNPAIVPLLGTLLFLALWQVAGRDGSRAIFWVVLLLALMVQFHLAAVFLLPSVGLILWLSGRKLDLRWASFGLLAAVVCYGPYLLGEWRQDWANTRAMFGGAGESDGFDPLSALVSPARYFLNYWAPRSLYSATEWQALRGQTFGGSAGMWTALAVSVVVAGMLLLGLLLEVRRRLAGRDRGLRALFARAPGLSFHAILILGTLLSGLLAGVSFRPRYCLVFLAPLFTLAGLGGAYCLERASLRRPFFLAAALLVLLNTWFLLSMFRFQGHHIDQGPRFLGSFRRLEEVYQALRPAARGRPIEVIDVDFEPPGGAPEMRWHQDTFLIRRYVELRDKDRGQKLQRDQEKLLVRLRNQPPAGPETVLFAGNGLRLVCDGCLPP